MFNQIFGSRSNYFLQLSFPCFIFLMVNSAASSIVDSISSSSSSSSDSASVSSRFILSCHNYSSNRKTSSFLCSCFPCHMNSLNNWLNLCANPSTVAGRNFTFGLTSMDPSVSLYSSSSSLYPIIFPLEILELITLVVELPLCYHLCYHF